MTNGKQNSILGERVIFHQNLILNEIDHSHDNILKIDDERVYVTGESILHVLKEIYNGYNQPVETGGSEPLEECGK